MLPIPPLGGKGGRAYMNWSGGKDSSLCLHRIMEEKQFKVDCLLTSINAHHNRVSMHGVRRELLQLQASSVGLPLQTIELPEEPGMEEYEQAMMEKVRFLKNNGFSHALFGDIFLEDLRRYREEKLQKLDISCVFPLWKISTTELVASFLQSGFKAIIVCVNDQYLDKSFCGRLIDASFLEDLPKNVDPCGENGEYHSFVFEGPLFKDPILFQKGDIVYRNYQAPSKTRDATDPCITTDKTGFYFCDLLPV
ncbi:Dph6-related ATP pyrophosphatase [Flavitalea flava]